MNRERRVNRWNPLIKCWTLLLRLREKMLRPWICCERKSCSSRMNPSFLLTFGWCRFQLSWINLEWEQHVKIAPDTRNRCLLYHRATGLFRDCSTGSMKVSHFQKLHLCLTNSNLIQTDLWREHKGINPRCDKRQTQSYYNLMLFFSLIFQQLRQWCYFFSQWLFWFLRIFRWLL